MEIMGDTRPDQLKAPLASWLDNQLGEKMSASSATQQGTEQGSIFDELAPGDSIEIIGHDDEGEVRAYLTWTNTVTADGGYNKYAGCAVSCNRFEATSPNRISVHMNLQVGASWTIMARQPEVLIHCSMKVDSIRRISG